MCSVSSFSSRELGEQKNAPHGDITIIYKVRDLKLVYSVVSSAAVVEHWLK
ncbi:hypothetical protein MY11210_005729 [Beauveria gryllotalpidicola]